MLTGSTGLAIIKCVLRKNFHVRSFCSARVCIKKVVASNLCVSRYIHRGLSLERLESSNVFDSRLRQYLLKTKESYDFSLQNKANASYTESEKKSSFQNVQLSELANRLLQGEDELLEITQLQEIAQGGKVLHIFLHLSD